MASVPAYEALGSVFAPRSCHPGPAWRSPLESCRAHEQYAGGRLTAFADDRAQRPAPQPGRFRRRRYLQLAPFGRNIFGVSLVRGRDGLLPGRPRPTSHRDLRQVLQLVRTRPASRPRHRRDLASSGVVLRVGGGVVDRGRVAARPVSLFRVGTSAASADPTGNPCDLAAGAPGHLARGPSHGVQPAIHASDRLPVRGAVPRRGLGRTSWCEGSSSSWLRSRVRFVSWRHPSPSTSLRRSRSDAMRRGGWWCPRCTSGPVLGRSS